MTVAVAAALDSLTACLWETASLSRRAMGIVHDLASVHGPERTVVDSCQRLEFYGLGACSCDAPRHLHGRDALVHLASVAAGVHAAALGEAQVLGQVRSAFRDAGRDLALLSDVAVASARELRKSERFDVHTGHLLDRALRIRGVPSQGSLLVVGTGRVGRLVAERGHQVGFSDVVVAGRTEPEDRWLESFPVRWTALYSAEHHPPVDVLVGCLGSGADEIDATSELPTVRRLVVDLGTPRNFGHLLDIDTPSISIAEMLATATRHRDRKRARLVASLGSIVDRRLAGLQENAGSAIGRLRQGIEATRALELRQLAKLNPGLDPVALDALTRSLLNRILHQPTARLRDDPRLAEAVAALFEIRSEAD